MSEYIRDDADEELDYFTVIPFVYNEDNRDVEYEMYAYGYEIFDSNHNIICYSDIYYSINGGEWTLCEYDVPFKVKHLDRVRMKCNGYELKEEWENDYGGYYYYSAGPWIQDSNYGYMVEGTPLSLLHGDNFKEKQNDLMFACFYEMFVSSSALIQINNPKTFLPSTELVDWCYNRMFENSSIYNAPELPAETLKEGCYYGMFTDCYNLKETPSLNAKTLVPFCYSYMFYDCSYLSYVKFTATDGFDAEDAVERIFDNCANDGFGVLSQELIDSDFGGAFLPNWAIISEGYPTNDEGYPESKIFNEYFMCFNADFKERYYDDQILAYYNYYESGPNEAGRQLFECITSFLPVGESFSMSGSGLFFNRQVVTSVYYGSYEDTNYLSFNLLSSKSYPDYAFLYSDGRFYVGKEEWLLYDYIKK